MRTKTLLLTAVLVAAGVATSMAQAVYSVNIVGYVNVDVPVGFSMIANQLDNKKGNMLGDLITGAATGTTIYKFDGAGFSPSTFIEGLGWSPDASLAPGEGAFIQVLAATKLTFVGEVKTGPQTVAIPAGFSIKSSILPISESLDGVGVGFPAQTGDTVYFFRGGGYQPATFIEGLGFSPEAKPNVGESFFVNKTSAGNWIRDFKVN
ncbi:MAG: hypothetical protein AAB676_17610 [Verrucomicrobiota bacterium]